MLFYSSEMEHKEAYWTERWLNGQTGWDIGYASTPLVEYFDQVEDKDVKVLIPGCGNAYEAEAFLEMGFRNVFILDISPEAMKQFQQRCPEFPAEQCIVQDYFDHQGQYDIIVEQTFFCALHPSGRERYCKHTRELLAPEGKVIGLLFDDPLFTDHPPYGGNESEYRALFEKHFSVRKLELATNSIKPRQGREFFIIFDRND